MSIFLYSLFNQLFLVTFRILSSPIGSQGIVERLRDLPFVNNNCQ